MDETTVVDAAPSSTIDETSEKLKKSTEEDETSRTAIDNCEKQENVPPEQPVYKIRPPLSEKFKPLSAKEIIHNILFDQLTGKTYSTEESVQWTKNIADLIKEKVKELNIKRYKYVVNVVLGEQHGAGLKIGTRCIWDAEADTYAFDTFLNDTIFCVAAVYAIYFY